MNAYPIGNDLTVKWSLLYSDGSVFPLSNYDYELSYRTNRGNKVVTDTSVISVDENILTWTFKGDEQVVSGRYTICLKITLSGSKVVELQYDNAFMLSPLSGFKGAGSEIVLQSYCDAIDLKDAVLQARKAMDIAGSAVNTAGGAATTANDAKAIASTANNTSTEAKTIANNAKTVADQAKDTADAAAATATQKAEEVAQKEAQLEAALNNLSTDQSGALALSTKVNEHGEKLSDLEAEIGIVKGHYTSTNNLIFDKSQIAVGSKIKVSFVLYHPTGKVAVYDADDKELKGFYITNGTIGQNYTFDSYVLPENYESVKITAWGDLDVEILVESLNPKHIAQSVAELESQVSELKSKPLEIPNKSISAEKLEDYDLLPVFITATNNDLNAIIEELYVFPQYVGSSQIQVRTYSKGIIVGAFDGNGVRLWAVRAYNLADSYKNGELIPLVVGVTTSNVAIDTLIGYCVIKDIDALTNASNDSTNGEFVNLSKATQSWLNPKISALRNMPTIENGASESSLITGVDITIPNNIIAVEGDTLQIFWRSIVGAVNPYIFDIYAVCSVGKSFPRYYEFKPTADMVGKSYNLEVYVKTNNGTIVAQKTATIKVVSTMDSPSSTKNILCIGASATAGGQWVGELNRRLTATSGDGTPANPTGLGLSNIAFVGRKVGTSNSIHLEATGGWRVQDYAGEGQRAVRFFVSGVDTISLGARYSCNGTIYGVQEVNVTEGVGNIRCTLENAFVVPSGKLVKQSGSGDAEITFTSYEQEKFNPFWNDAESRLDFSSYANEYCNGHIDCMIWHCGVNDLSSASIGTMMSVIENITISYRDIFRAYHEQFPSGKIIVSSVPVGSTNGGFAANYGSSAYVNYFTFAKKVQAYAKALSDLCEESEFAKYVEYSPVLEEFDAENGYPIKQTAVNNRSSVTEAVGTNGVHPTAEGSYMVADAIYRIINTIDMGSNGPVVVG